MTNDLCPKCGGTGVLGVHPVHSTEPDSHNPETGECIPGRCPVPEEELCPICNGTGKKCSCQTSVREDGTHFHPAGHHPKDCPVHGERHEQKLSPVKREVGKPHGSRTDGELLVMVSDLCAEKGCKSGFYEMPVEDGSAVKMPCHHCHTIVRLIQSHAQRVREEAVREFAERVRAKMKRMIGSDYPGREIIKAELAALKEKGDDGE